MAQRVAGSAHDFYGHQRKPLDVIFRPKTVALIGATERRGSVGRTILWNLITNSFGGTVYPVTPHHASVLGIRAYPSIDAVPETVDLAIIAVKAEVVPDVVRECVAAGVRGAIIISAGFREVGADGVALEQEISAIAQQGGLRIVGPNCLGIINPISGLNATFARKIAHKGTVGFISQSGALCSAVLDWSLNENVGFSSFISIGSMLDVDWGDLITYLGSDQNTKSIVIYMESIGNARSFLSAAREVALTKPIIVIKPGQTAEAARAAATHSGAMIGSDAVLDAAFRRCGVLRVRRLSQLFDMAEALAKQPRPKGPNLTILTNAGGPGALATDMLLSTGGTLTTLSAETHAALDDILPGYWSHGNPVDMLGNAGPEQYAQCLDVLANDPGTDGLLVILSPQAQTEPTQTATALRQIDRSTLRGKPLLASWMGGADVAAGEAILNQAEIPTYAYPDTAARIFSYMWQYTKNLRSLYETPYLPPDVTPDRRRVSTIIEAIRAAGRTTLSELESKQLLDAYGIPTVTTYLAQSAAEAVQMADEIGYPVVVKVNSTTIVHKSDVGGVYLNLHDAGAVQEAYTAIADRVGHDGFAGVTVQPMIAQAEAVELIVGAFPDPEFGPVVLFGGGGTLVEVFKDRALGLPPLNSTLAQRMMRRTRIYNALQGVRGREPVDLPALESLLVQFSYLIVEQRWIKEIEINPLLVSADRMIALDARIVLYASDVSEEALPHLAIRPYPVQYEQPWTTKQGLPVLIRPIRPEDEPLMRDFQTTLSEQSIYMRYFHAINLSQRMAHEYLVRVCHIDYDREMALVVVYDDPETGQQKIIAGGRLSKSAESNEAEFAMLISDNYQRQGLGTELLKRLVQIGCDEGVDHIVAYMLPTNTGMKRISERLGFSFSIEDDTLKATLDLSGCSKTGLD
ncbi:MAG: bifunctional acetate--CoA ligase family protein/GNAT family N-acetyltransferase [Anaerolineae bacterium]|nr:bifunctional acetate--CoA ligase family protein/GNAT family N-acetyltransferase [Anaerolineae bacterium]